MRARAHIHISEFASERRVSARARACRCAVHSSSGRAQGGETRGILRIGRGGCPPGARAPTGKAMRMHPQRGRGYLYRRQRRIARDAPTKRRAAFRVAPRQPRAGLLIPARSPSARYSRAHANAREMAPRDPRRGAKDIRRFPSRCTYLPLEHLPRRPSLRSNFAIACCLHYASRTMRVRRDVPHGVFDSRRV